MAGYRQIHTQIWKDEWYIELSPKEKLVFVYLFSNELASISGIYKIPVRVISNETGVSHEDVIVILEDFERADKIMYADGVLWVKNMSKFHANASPRTQKKVEADIEKIPDCAVKQSYLLYRNGINTVSIPRSESESESESGNKNESGSKSGNASAKKPATEKPAAAADLSSCSELYTTFLEEIHAPDPPPERVPYPEWESIFSDLTAEGAATVDVREAVRWLRANGKHPRHPKGIVGSVRTAMRKRKDQGLASQSPKSNYSRYLKGQWAEFIEH